MLSKIKIGKFLYIKDIELELTDGLNVFTGETGVGKSLIVDAISFVLGKKGKYSEGDYVELSFENVDNQYAEDGLLFLAREVKNGKSYYYVNGKRATLSTLKEASEGIIAIHGQHHQQALFNRKEHIKMLDKYAQIDDLLEKYRKLYKEYKSLEKEEQELIQQQSNRLRELDILKYQLQELEEADLKEGEKQQLEEKYNYLSNILKIKEAVYNASWNLAEMKTP
ncbi:AAA family ATPase [Hydrogenivirga sp. 128-5-R1-1]|uniref:AAA family ATPase n=1 Tax=Hydrogenivirga sp. 128-5-R1-1 TaxID=392423 RepID=UPI00015F342B|nr:AAA family ATPase [Hydrogenivirga sp. 128-5-R1-1]EDP73407.1 recombination protein RecN [Hydrogenivirga sp. 128-5-R1-1]